MIHFTIFAGHEGRLRLDGTFYLTMFGGCELIRPTLARHAMTKRELEREGRATRQKPFFLTIFGGAGIKLPTLAEEYLDLQESLGSGLLAMADWERSVTDLTRSDSLFGSFTLFGGFDEGELPSENEEIEAIALHRHLGNLSDTAGQMLQYGIGRRDAERYATVHRAVNAESQDASTV